MSDGPTVVLYVDEQGLPVDLTIDGLSLPGIVSASITVEGGEPVRVSIVLSANRLHVVRTTADS